MPDARLMQPQRDLCPNVAWMSSDEWKENLIYKNMWNWPSDLFLILEKGWADNSTKCWES